MSTFAPIVLAITGWLIAAAVLTALHHLVRQAVRGDDQAKALLVLVAFAVVLLGFGWSWSEVVK